MIASRPASSLNLYHDKFDQETRKKAYFHYASFPLKTLSIESFKQMVAFVFVHSNLAMSQIEKELREKILEHHPLADFTQLDSGDFYENLRERFKQEAKAFYENQFKEGQPFAKNHLTERNLNAEASYRIRKMKQFYEELQTPVTYADQDRASGRLHDIIGIPEKNWLPN